MLNSTTAENPENKRRLFFNSSTRSVEIPCLTWPTWSHFTQDKLKISIYLSLNKCKNCIKLLKFCISYFNYYEFTCCIENSVYPDQLASLEAS